MAIHGGWLATLSTPFGSVPDVTETQVNMHGFIYPQLKYIHTM